MPHRVAQMATESLIGATQPRQIIQTGRIVREARVELDHRARIGLTRALHGLHETSDHRHKWRGHSAERTTTVPTTQGTSRSVEPTPRQSDIGPAVTSLMQYQTSGTLRPRRSTPRCP